ncbi:MAG: signal recognition particle protein [Candidatus Methylomirabilales bacterium]
MMFHRLSDRLQGIFKKLRGHGKLTEEQIGVALREIRLALLEADVHYGVVKDFLDRVRERAIGREVLQSLTPGQQVVKIVFEELTVLLGGKGSGLAFAGRPPSVVMLVGLQGSGKTTTAAKMAVHLKQEGRLPLLVAADTRRPAATKQLAVLGEQSGIEVFANPRASALDICQEAVRYAQGKSLEPVFLDTGGRLHIDDDLMAELKDIKQAVQPVETLLVLDAMTGQDALGVAKTFDTTLELSGFILTKLDGDARGGAALSIRAVTGRPIKFVGVGEKLNALEPFHPERTASRILGMGDVLSLVERAEAAVDRAQAEELARKIQRDTYTLEDFREHLLQFRRMGSVEELVGMLPGLPAGMGDLQVDGKALTRMEAIMNSMTKEEQRNPGILNGSRRQRIAKGSGTSVAHVNQLLRQFQQMQRLIRQVVQAQKKGKTRGIFPPG